MHTLLNITHSKDTTGVQNISNNILLLTETDLASGQKKKMPSPNRCLMMKAPAMILVQFLSVLLPRTSTLTHPKVN